MSEPATARVVSHGLGPARPSRGQWRVAVVGMSEKATCGMRDHATLLAGALEDSGVTCSMHWLSREHRALRRSRGEVRAWATQLGRELEARPPDAVLLHYSAFAYSYRGLPLLAGPVLSALDRARAPILCVMHELAYPWGRAGWRGAVWAISQRARLAGLVRRSSAVLVTADFQQRWLSTRRWLPSRPTLVAPVFSNLPAPSAPPPRAGGRGVIGVFGYAYQGAAVSLVLDALAALAQRGIDARLALLGAPGRSSPPAEEWLAAAVKRGVSERLSFAGPMPAQELSDALAACEVLVMCDAGGPSSRKGTLAGSLASGTPVVALDGPRSWPELVRAHAAEVVAPDAARLADALVELLADAERGRALGARGRAFAEERMGLAVTARAVRALLAEIMPAQRRVGGAAAS